MPVLSGFESIYIMQKFILLNNIWFFCRSNNEVFIAAACYLSLELSWCVLMICNWKSWWAHLQMQPRTVRLEHHTLKLLKYWTWQFVVIRPVCSVLMVTLQILGLYTNWISWTSTIILNISVSMALYALVVFYHVFAKELTPHKPLAKFMCIKGIVFFCFWQVLFLVKFLSSLCLMISLLDFQNFVTAW